MNLRNILKCARANTFKNVKRNYVLSLNYTQLLKTAHGLS